MAGRAASANESGVFAIPREACRAPPCGSGLTGFCESPSSSEPFALLEGLSEQRTKRANYIRRAFHRAPLIDDEFFLLPLRFVNRGTEISFVQLSTHTNTLGNFSFFFSKVEKTEKYTQRKIPT